MQNPSVEAQLALAGRVLLALLFVIEAWIKLNGYAGAVGYMQAFGIPGFLLPGAIGVELVGGALIAVGWHTRPAALALAGFCIVTPLIFHTKFSDANQLLHFLKDFAIAGGFLVLAAHGAGAWSVDAKRGMRGA